MTLFSESPLRTHPGTSFLWSGVILAFLTVAPAGAQNPVIGTAGVVNAASGLDAFTIGIAQGSYFLVLGTGMATSTTALAGFPLPTSFGGAQVKVRSLVNNTSYDVPLYFASPAQINAVLPSGVPVGQADLTVTVGSVTSRASRINVQKTRVGVFTIFNQPSGQGLVQN